MRILVADDDPLTMHMVVYRLRQWGHDVMTAGDGVEAWKALEEHELPHVAILDWMMPGLDGLELCRRLRAQSNDPYVYVILLTGKDETQDMITGFRSRCR